ncbi:MAG: DCC1-like thiol-disulfide oxidoreductase family protein [Nitrososphaerales archaeon]
MLGNYLLAYDAACGPCSRFKVVVDFLDARGLIDFVSLRQADEAGALESVAPSLRYDSFHLIAPGRPALSGADALLPLVGMLLPGGGAFSKVLQSVPGCGRAISLVYSTISRLHYTGACGTAAR